MTTPGLVSVVMPAFNAGPYLWPAVQSVLNQSYDNIELIVVDDGSTDGTPDVLAAVHDSRLRVLRQQNAGESAARNAGLSHSQGDYVMWNDADDISLPHRAAALVEALGPAGASYAHSDMLLIDGQGGPLGYWQGAPVPRGRMLQFLLRVGTPFNNPSMLVRREVLAGKTFSALRIGTDTDMVRQFAAQETGVHVPEPLLLYRRWPGNVTHACGEAAEAEHVEILLGAHTPEELAPEVTRGRPPECRRPVALALVALALQRRGLPTAASSRLAEAAATCSAGSQHLVAAVMSIVNGDLVTAGRCLSFCPPEDAIAENLRGELLAGQGDFLGATNAFQRALNLDPSYYEAVLNLRGIGGARGMNLVDRTWTRFASAGAGRN
jgi:Glycosyl transferase family 2